MARGEFSEFGMDQPFNMALAFLNRCHDALVGCNESRQMNDTFAWKEFLDTLFLELYPYMDDTESMKKKELDLTTLEKLYAASDVTYFRAWYKYKGNAGFFVDSPLDKLNILMEKKLRMLMRVRDFLQPRQSDPAKAIGGG